MDSLTDWWEEMGVEVDHGLVEAYLAAAATSESPAPQQDAPAAPRRRKPKNWVQEATALAAGCDTLEALKAAIESYDGSPLKAAAQNTVVFDGTPGATLMVIGEGPGAEEDRRGLPFVGRAGQLLDRMLAAIGRTREENVLISNVNYWRPPGNRNPEPEELEVCRPFVERMIELARPKLIVAAGGVPATSLLETSNGIMKLRGTEHVFTTAGGYSIPLIPLLHPAYLLRRPQEKSRAWRDLLLVEKRLRELGG
ncbi:MAG: uracil-DNA glycosylase [Hyphomonas sp.]|uniref:uracil-DNA glycosylase n=1 Tax=Hyphomonas sp. TaxID=87 RepID=UPI00352912A1